MISFTELVTAAQAVRGLLAKGRGHKYIKRIPVGQTPSGGIKYRYIYNATSTVGGKNLLDEAHLKVGTKLMLHSEDGAEVHAHITEVKGDKVTFVYDDGDRKGETRTVTKQKLLGDFNQEHDVKGQLSAAKEKLLADIESAVAGGTISEKQLARLVERLKSLDPDALTTSKDALKQAGDAYVNAIRGAYDAIASQDQNMWQAALRDIELNNNALKAEIVKDLEIEGKTPREQAETLRTLKPLVDQIINNPLSGVEGMNQQVLVFLSDVGRDLNKKLEKYERAAEEHQTALQEQDEDFKKIQAYDVDVNTVAPSALQDELQKVQDVRALIEDVTGKYPLALASNYRLESQSRGKLQRVEDSLKQRIKSNQGTLDAQQLAGLKRGDTLQYKGKSYKVRSKSRLKGINGFRISFDAEDGSDSMSLKVYPEGVSASDQGRPVIVSIDND